MSLSAKSKEVDHQVAPKILGVGLGHPEHYYEQSDLIGAFSSVWGEEPKVQRRLNRLHQAVQVNGRYLALPMDQYLRLDTFGKRNDAFITTATEVGAMAIQAALSRCGLAVHDVDALFFTTITGIATPSIDARLINRLGFRSDVKRTPLFGLGCVGGAAGISRMSDYLRAYPDKCALMFSVELCSLTLQLTDLSVPNLVSSGLFGDGGACVVGVGAQHDKASAGISVVDVESTFFPNTERVMGWDINEDGFNIVLSAGVPDLAHREISNVIPPFLRRHALGVEDIAAWVCHPGGPKVIEAIERGLSLELGALDLTRASLNRMGNLSSASVLHVLHDTFETKPAEGEWVVFAMGPGFCAESILLSWP